MADIAQLLDRNAARFRHGHMVAMAVVTLPRSTSMRATFDPTIGPHVPALCVRGG
jgi:hypothetical protein